MDAIGVKIVLCGDVRCTTAFPPRTDIRRHTSNVRFVPKGDIRIAADFLIRSPPRRAPSGSGNTAKSRTSRHDMKLWVLTARQAHREYRTFARLARHRHVAAHHARELARDGQAEAGAAVLPGAELPDNTILNRSADPSYRV